MITFLVLTSLLLPVNNSLTNTYKPVQSDTTPRILVSNKSVITTKIAFNASIPGDFVDLPSGAYTKLPFNWTNYNYGNAYSKDQAKFTAPVYGIYHFDMQLDGETNNAKCTFTLSLFKNGSYVCETIFNMSHVGYGRDSFNSSCDVELQKGDIIELKGMHDFGGVKRFYGNSARSYFNGHLVFAL